VPNVRKITNPDQAPQEQQNALPLDAPPAEPKQRGRKPGANGNGKGAKNGSGANLGFEATLWAAADKLRNNMDAGEYKHVVLGLIFLKYISDAFEERHGWLLGQAADADSDYYVREERARYQVAEDRDEYVAEHIFRVPQESTNTTWRLCKMNLAIRGIESNIGPHHADSFHRDLRPDLKADFILANPPFNISDWGGERLRDDVRWKYGVPPAGNANYAWMQHMVHHLAPSGVAGFILANGSMSSNTSGEGEIGRALIEADMVDCMVALPGQLFYTTQIPVCLWFLTRSKANGKFRDRRRQILFIDARKLGTLFDRTQRELSEAEIAQIAETYHAWRSKEQGGYQDIAGFCKSRPARTSRATAMC
jgi:type I restriction-modification system DNA methylase subunit